MLRAGSRLRSPARRHPVKISLRRAVSAAAAGIGCLGALWAGAASAETLSIHGSAGFANEVMTPYRDKIESLTGHKLNPTVGKAVAGGVSPHRIAGRVPGHPRQSSPVGVAGKTQADPERANRQLALARWAGPADP